MNKDNAHDYIPLLQALGDGKTIQYKRTDNEWEDLVSVDFNYSSKYYRVKPEPRTFEMWLNKERQIMHPVKETESDCCEYGWERITVQEVLQ